MKIPIFTFRHQFPLSTACLLEKVYYILLRPKNRQNTTFIQSIISLGNVLIMKSQPPDLIISALYKTTHIFKESQNPFIFRSH